MAAKIPTRKECFDIFARYRTPNHVMAHCLAVNRAAMFLARKLREKGEDVDVEMVDRASLIHDFAKPVDFTEVRAAIFPGNDSGLRISARKPREWAMSSQDIAAWASLYAKYLPENTETHVHHHVGAEILRAYGYKELGDLVEHHGFFHITEDKLDTWEKKIMFYSDMRAMGSRIINLNDRFNDFSSRYGKTNSPEITRMVNDVHESTFRLEKELFERIGMKPEELAQYACQDMEY